MTAASLNPIHHYCTPIVEIFQRTLKDFYAQTPLEIVQSGRAKSAGRHEMIAKRLQRDLPAHCLPGDRIRFDRKYERLVMIFINDEWPSGIPYCVKSYPIKNYHTDEQDLFRTSVLFLGFELDRDGMLSRLIEVEYTTFNDVARETVLWAADAGEGDGLALELIPTDPIDTAPAVAALRRGRAAKPPIGDAADLSS